MGQKYHKLYMLTVTINAEKWFIEVEVERQRIM